MTAEVGTAEVRDLRVSRLGLTPVKGTRHVELDRIELDVHGPVGDRTFCLVDPIRARVLRTVQNPRLIAVRTSWDGRTLSCRFPDDTEVAAKPGAGSGAELSADYWGRRAELEFVDGPWAAAFSGYLGRSVRLARIRTRGTVVYGAAVTVVTATTLRAIGSRLSRSDAIESLAVLAARFRSTLVLDGDDLAPGVEQSWLGRELRVGSATVRLRAPVPRCAVIDLDPATGERNQAMQIAAGARPGHEPVVGVDAVVVRPGIIRRDDPASLTDGPAGLPSSTATQEGS